MAVGDFFGQSIATLDPTFGTLDDDAEILQQAAVLALGTAYGSLPEFPEYGFDWDSYLLAPLTTDQVARLPEEVRAALEQEVRFQTVSVTIVSQTRTPGGGIALALALDITPTSGTRLDFTIGVARTSDSGVAITTES